MAGSSGTLMRGRWHSTLARRLILFGAIVLAAAAVVIAVSPLGADLLRRTHAEQSPAQCSSNDFVLRVQKNLTYFSDTATVHYTVLAGNPNSSGAGCDAAAVDLTFTTPDGVAHSLGSGLSFPIGTAVSTVGAASYVPSTSAPEFNGWVGYNGVAWVAMAEASGELLNNPVQDDPWQLRKTVSVVPASIDLSARTSPPGAVPPGDPVTVTFVLHNDGIGLLGNPQVTSPQCDPAPVPPTGTNQGDVNGNGVLDTGESWIFTCGFMVTDAMDVTGAGSGQLPDGGLTIDWTNDPDATATVSLLVAPSGAAPDAEIDPDDADDPDGDDPGGDDPDADDPDGDAPGGDAPDTDAPDGDAPDGDAPVGDGADDGSSGSDAPSVEATDDPPADESRPQRPSGLPDAGSGGLLGLSGAQPVAYGAIVMGLLTLGFAVFLRRVAGRGGTRRG
jgi:hypothetical protein